VQATTPTKNLNCTDVARCGPPQTGMSFTDKVMAVPFMSSIRSTRSRARYARAGSRFHFRSTPAGAGRPSEIRTQLFLGPVRN
jgi:hypothetical protein